MNATRFRCLLLIPLLLAACAAPTRRITIIHHNDFHAWNVPWGAVDQKGDSVYIQGAAGLEGLATALRDTSSATLWLFAGDEFTGTAPSTLTSGGSQIQIAGRLSSDIVVFGNHEFDHGLDRAEAYRDSIGKIVLGGANLRYPDGKPFSREYFDTTVGGVPIRVIGLVPIDLHELTSEGATGKLLVYEPDSVVRALLPSKERLAVVLSHLGLDRDSLLAAHIPELDLIVGGHTHATLRRPWLVGPEEAWVDSLPPSNGKRLPGTLIVQAGARGIYLGALGLTIKNGNIIAAAGKLYRNDGSLASPDAELAAFAGQIDRQATAGLEEVVAELVEPMTRQGEESSLGRWEADIFREATGAEVAFQNPGGLRKDLGAGKLTLRDVFEANPFGNTLATFEMSGEELMIVLKTLATEPREYLQASGISATLDRRSGNALNVLVGGVPLDLAKRYRVTTNSYVFGHFETYFGVPVGDRVVNMPQDLDRDIIAKAARSAGAIRAPKDVRLVYVTE